MVDAIGASCDFSNGTIASFNGNDARALVRVYSDTSEVIVDVIGGPGADPGDGWTVAGTAAATKDHRLVRGAEYIGNTAWASSASTEWVVLPTGDTTGLGSHTHTCND